MNAIAITAVQPFHVEVQDAPRARRQVLLATCNQHGAVTLILAGSPPKVVPLELITDAQAGPVPKPL